MAVYTEVSDEDLQDFIVDYDIGQVISCKGIAEGVQNSNFMLHTKKGYFILTLYEKMVHPEDLPFFIELMDHLALKGLACPTPLHGKDGRSLRSICGKPAAVVTYLEGLSPKKMTVKHCAQLGQALALLHIKGQDFPKKRENSLGLLSWRPLFEKIGHRSDEVKKGLGEIIERELDYLEKHWPHHLPTGVIHADLFPDNVFFIGENLSGLIDFYFACTDYFIYDLAVCLNAWCFESDLSFNVTKASHMVSNYQRLRPLSREEMLALPLLARGASLRFLLTRLYDWFHTPEGVLVKRKDPLEYAKKLSFHADAANLQSYGLY